MGTPGPRKSFGITEATLQRNRKDPAKAVRVSVSIALLFNVGVTVLCASFGVHKPSTKSDPAAGLKRKSAADDDDMSVQHQPKDAKLNGTLNAGAVERETSASAAKNSSQSKAAHGQEAGAEPQSQARANARGKASKASTKARKADTVAKAPNAPPSEPAAKVKKVDLTSLASNSQ